jgi:thiamine-phosphate pyrophosphorylase
MHGALLLKRSLAGIYAILDPEQTPALDAFAEALLAGGIRLLQLRDKRGTAPDAVARLHATCRSAGATLLINDDLAAAALADGVHLGQEDLRRHPFEEIARRMRGKIVGISAATPASALAAYGGGAHYLGAGPFGATTSKADARAPIGADGVRRIVASTPLPVAAIGGITLNDLPAVAASGARMAAVLSWLARAADPSAAAAVLVARWAELTA